MTTLGERIKQLRQEKHMTQEDLGKIIGVVKSTVSMYESDKSIPSDEIKKIMADLFGVTIDYLLGRTDVREQSGDKITDALSDDPELKEFWDDLKEREDLQLLFKQTRNLSNKDIQQIIKIIKTFEDEEKNL